MAYYEHITVLPNNEMKCTLCNDTIHNSERLLEAHLHDKRHKELYMKSLLTTNHIISGTVDLFCYICNCNVPVAELISHVQSTKHQSKYMTIENLVCQDGSFINLPDAKSTHSLAYCIICDRQVEFIHDTVKNHIDSPVHREAKAMVLQPLNGIFSVEGYDQYLWCKICQKFFDNYIEVIFQHVSEGMHAEKMAKISRLIKGQNVEIEKYLQDCKNDKAFCSRCKIEVPCNVDNLQSHVNGKKHKVHHDVGK